jgi:hypothetical protein
MSVYCEDCLYFQPGKRIPHPFGPPYWIKELCQSPHNYRDNHKTLNSSPISIPKIINKNNNCTWYIDKNIEDSSSSSGDYETSSSSSI